jgi:polyisoprenoid-binding protein YceI
MKKIILILAVALFSIGNGNVSNLYLTKTGHASFFSKAPIQNIDAQNDKVGVVLNSSTNEIAFEVSIRNFEFANKKMQEDFNDNFMETEKYPDARFNGKINEQMDYSKDGTYQGTASGKLKIHGVEKDVTEKGTITIKSGSITINSEFNVALADYNIKIPKILWDKIAENILVKVDATLSAQGQVSN